MIFDNILNADDYINLGEKIKKGLDFIKNNDLKTFENGKYGIDGEKVVGNIQEYETKENGLFEAHRKYIDIQYIISGVEKIGVSHISNLKTNLEYDEEKDVEFFDGEDAFIVVPEGYFTIFYPQDGHKPCILHNTKSQVKKLVIKILI